MRNTVIEITVLHLKIYADTAESQKHSDKSRYKCNERRKHYIMQCKCTPFYAHRIERSDYAAFFIYLMNDEYRYNICKQHDQDCSRHKTYQLLDYYVTCRITGNSRIILILIEALQICYIYSIVLIKKISYFFIKLFDTVFKFYCTFKKFIRSVL